MSSDEQRIKLRQLIRRQHGVVSLEQAVTAGYTRQAVARKVATKAWFPAGPRVYQVAEHAETPRSRRSVARARATTSTSPAASSTRSTGPGSRASR